MISVLRKPEAKMCLMDEWKKIAGKGIKLHASISIFQRVERPFKGNDVMERSQRMVTEAFKAAYNEQKKAVQGKTISS